MTSASVPGPRLGGTDAAWLSPAYAAKLKRRYERGLVRSVGMHVLAWGVLGAVLSGAFEAAIVHSGFARVALRAFLPFCAMGLWLGAINWSSAVLGYARWREHGGRTSDEAEEPAPAATASAAPRWSRKKRRAKLSLFALVGALVVWFPGSLYLSRLDSRVQAAVVAGQSSTVQAQARWLLRMAALYPLNWAHGNAIQHGHVALGLAALEQGDVAAASDHLLEAGRTPGSPQLDTFGPNMALAQALLDRGERDVVLAYLDECREFWRMDDGKLDAWSAAVRAGERPDFKANLDH